MVLHNMQHRVYLLFHKLRSRKNPKLAAAFLRISSSCAVWQSRLSPLASLCGRLRVQQVVYASPIPYSLNAVVSPAAIELKHNLCVDQSIDKCLCSESTIIPNAMYCTKPSGQRPTFCNRRKAKLVANTLLAEVSNRLKSSRLEWNDGRKR